MGLLLALSFLSGRGAHGLGESQVSGERASRLSAVAVDAAGRVLDAQRQSASLERTPPEPSSSDDPDAVRFVVFGEPGALPHRVEIASRGAAGTEIDRLPLELTSMPCPVGLGPSCVSSELVRTVGDDIDRRHPLIEGRSVRGEVGGTLDVVTPTRTLVSLRVGGPRVSPIGPLAGMRGHLRLLVVRDRPKGAVPFGVDEMGAKALARRQLGLANSLWGQCGISFGPESEADVRVVDPPPKYLLAVGCDLGLPSSGGEIRLRADGREVKAIIPPRMSPRAAARLVARALEKAGFAAKVSENARIESGAGGTADVLVRRRDGQFAVLDRPEEKDGRLSTDATLTACIGGVDLTDGLDHFVDVDAPAGTVEERALVKAFDDGDPAAIKVFMVLGFAGGGRIGESFIHADRSSVRNVIIEDRAGVRADRASFALAHELGHVLLDMPGHPDDYGTDVPTLLMDSDATDPSSFGPRRLTLAECARAHRQSGPLSLVPLLAPIVPSPSSAR